MTAGVATSTAAFDAIASLFAYPDLVLRQTAPLAVDAVASVCPEAAELLWPLADHLTGKSLADCEEMFVTTLELNPVVALEVGWQLYGEQYARGTFLVRMRQLTREAGLPQPTELADHLPNVLRVIPRVAPASATKLAVRFTLPAIDKMRSALGDESPYGALLAATATLLIAHFGTEVPCAE